MNLYDTDFFKNYMPPQTLEDKAAQAQQELMELQNAYAKRQSIPQAPNFTSANLGTRAFPHDPSVFDEWGNLALDEEKGNYHEPPRGLINLTNKLGGLWDWGTALPGMAFRALSGIPGLGMLMGLLNPGKMRGMNYAKNRYNTQAEYEANRAARQQQKRVDYMLDRRAAGKAFSQKNLNEQTMGSKPGWYGSVWGGKGRGITGGKQIPGAPTNLGKSVHGEGPIGGNGNQGTGLGTDTPSGHAGGWGPGARKDGGRIGYQGGELVEQETDFIQGPQGAEEFQETVVEGQPQPSREQLEALARHIFQLPLDDLNDQQLVVVYQAAMQGEPMEEAVQEEDVQFAANGGLASLL